MDRLERLTRGQNIRPQISEDKRKRMVMATKRRQKTQRVKRERKMLANIESIEKKQGY